MAHDDPDPHPPFDISQQVDKLEQLLADKGLVDPQAIDLIAQVYEHEVGPRNGARVVAYAWANPEFRERLLANATDACAELGYEGRQGEHLVAVENGPKLHNLVVCTLCSCYPWPLLGLPPVWYKSAPYRSRAVIDPRGVLAEFGTVLDDDIEIRVWDSTAEIRYIVIPERPADTEHLTVDELAELVTRDAMIGVARTLAS